MEEVSELVLTEEYEELYNDLIKGGMSEDEALEQVAKVRGMEDVYSGQSEREEMDRGITIRLQYSKEDILKIIPDYDSLDKKTKDNWMWQLGFNTRTAQLFEEERYHTNLSGKRVFGKVIYGAERLDREWLRKLDSKNRNVASDEARSYVRMKYDQGYREDIKNLSRR